MCGSKLVLFVLPRMVTGGVERVTLSLIEEFQKKNIKCVLVLRKKQGLLIQEASELVEIHELAPKNLFQLIPALSRFIKERKPDSIITAFTDIGFFTLIARQLAGSSASIIHGVHNIHLSIAAPRGVRGWLIHHSGNLLAHIVYRWADKIVAVSKGIAEELRDIYRISPAKVSAIYNPVIRSVRNEANVIAKIKAPNEPFRIISLGRLETQKGFDLLIEAASLLDSEKDWHIEIWGEGNERKRLTELISKLELNSRVELKGSTLDPSNVMERADLFVMASRWEGFGNTLVEAMAVGVPVIATDCPYGPREILQGGSIGVLVPLGNPVALAKAIDDSIENVFVEQKRLFERARDFTFAKAAERWMSLLV